MTNADPSWPSHGGQVAPLLARFGLTADHAVLDFSANINPLGPPAWLSEWLASALSGVVEYPDPDYREACTAIAESEGLALDQVLLTNGGVEAVFLAAALHAGRRAVIVQPTFSEYARACRHYGLTVEDCPLEAQQFELDVSRALAAMSRDDVLFLCRPNNPTGTLVERRKVERLLAAGLEQGCRVVVDEAFIDFVTPDERLTPLLSRYPNLILLRSLTKCQAIPGLRLGYLLGPAETVARARALQMPWSVNHLAASLVSPLLADQDHMAQTRQWFVAEHPRLGEGLVAAGLRVAPSRANFFLVQPAAEPEVRAGQSLKQMPQQPRTGRRKGHLPWMANLAPREGGTAPPRRPVDGSAQADTSALFEWLLRSGILARHTHNFPGLDGGWLRLALRSRADNDRLLAVLAERRSP